MRTPSALRDLPGVAPTRRPAPSGHHHRLGGAALLGALVTMLVAPHAAAQDTRTVQFSGRDIAVYNYVGTLRVVGAGGSRAEADVTLRGSDAAELRIEQIERDGRDVLLVRYPDETIRPPASARNSTIRTRVGRDGTWGNGMGRGREVEIRDSRGALDASADIELRVPRGYSTRVHLLAGTVDVSNVDGELHVDVAAASITSRDTRGPLWLDTGSGDVNVSGVEGDLHLDTGSGDVTVRGASGDDIDADTGSGDVTLSDVRYRSGRFDTGSGRVRLTSATLDEVNLDTGSGDVLAEFLRTPRAVSADAGSGSITVGLPANAGMKLRIDARRSRISSDFPIQVTEQSRDELRGTIGSGEGLLVVETGSGAVRLRKLP